MLNKKLLPQYIEIETSTLCNRVCNWCPNSVYERGRKQNLMKSDLFDTILKSLKTVDFQGDLALHNYNEPLLDPFLTSRINSLKESLPDSNIFILTNGDYLTKTKVEELNDYEVSFLRITNYDDLSLDEISYHLNKSVMDLQLEYPLQDISDKFGKKYESKYGGMDVVFYFPNKYFFTTRGGLMDESKMEISDHLFCNLPFESCAIDYEGNMKLCCEIYPADPTHRKNGIVGNFTHSSFQELWFSDFMNDIRKNFIYENVVNEICKNCENKPKHSYTHDKKTISLWKQYLEV